MIRSGCHSLWPCSQWPRTQRCSFVAVHRPHANSTARLVSPSSDVIPRPTVSFCSRFKGIQADGLLECLESLSFPEINVHKSQVGPAAVGTASWIWTHPVYCSFSAQNSCILWIRGKPGSGKSVLARAIHQQLLSGPENRNEQSVQPLLGCSKSAPTTRSNQLSSELTCCRKKR